MNPDAKTWARILLWDKEIKRPRPKVEIDDDLLVWLMEQGYATCTGLTDEGMEKAAMEAFYPPDDEKPVGFRQ